MSSHSDGGFFSSETFTVCLVLLKILESVAAFVFAPKLDLFEAIGIV
jgi:hypothetical protein